MGMRMAAILTVLLLHREDPALMIMDAAGRMVMGKTPFRGETLDVSRVPEGCYEMILRWPDGGQARTVLVVQR